MNLIAIAVFIIFSASMSIGRCFDGKFVPYTRFVARVMYDGTDLRGFQEQGDCRTVQQILRETLSQRFDRPISCVGAGRTDSGVHARGQAIHFDCPGIDNIRKFEFCMNNLLPRDIRMYDIRVAPESSDPDKNFHVTREATAKHYRYSFCTNKVIDPMKSRYYARFWRPFDAAIFNQSLQLYVGTHDFVGFTNKVEKIQRDYDRQQQGLQLDTIRTVNEIRLIDDANGYYHVDVYLKSALFRMVRNLIGTSWMVAAGRLTLDEQIACLQDKKHRTTNTGISAPPEGLCLEHVYFDKY